MPIYSIISLDPRSCTEQEETYQTLQGGCKGYAPNVHGAVRIGYAVRRLLPIECERLMGLPDKWTDIPGASDTARYKALGNSIAVPCLDFIMGRIEEVTS